MEKEFDEANKYFQNLFESGENDDFYEYRENISNLNCLLISADLEGKRSKWTTYSYNGFNVPRVTSIISDTINKEYLVKWAAKLGDRYSKCLAEILDTGSLAHAYIEDFINYGKIKTEYQGFNKANTIQAMKAYQNFRSFWGDFEKKGYKIEPIKTEIPFATPWYGGTIDFIAYITPPDGGYKRLYILDFKTSKKVEYNYFLQLMFYANAYGFLRRTKDPVFTSEIGQDLGHLGRIGGIGIIRVDKESDKYEYILADWDYDYLFLSDLSETTDSMLNWYYHMNTIETQYNKFKKQYIERGGIDGLYR